MKQGRNEQSLLRLSRLIVSLGFLLPVCAAQPMLASAATITVTNPTDVAVPFTCNLRQAIVAHNQKTQPFPSNCTAGSSDGVDTIQIGRFPGDRIVDLGSPLPGISAHSILTIRPIESGNVCVSLRQSAYMTVFRQATLNLEGIGIIVNGAEFRSPIDNEGGTLNIFPHGTLECDFSNQSGRDRKTSVGGVLNNRNDGTATIDANFINSSAGDRGGAILVDSGTVTIKRGNFSNDHAGTGGAIFVNKGATLNITSSNFQINHNRASGAGGAIYSDGGTLNIQRDPGQSLGNVSIASNSAGGGGGAIFANGGQLFVDGVEINNNSSNGSGGAIVVSGVRPPKPASITRTYFHDNSSNTSGGAVYVGNFSTLNLSASTFARDRATGLGGGVHVDILSNLNVLNSTFFGGAHRDGIVVSSGLANVVFSTIFAANLGTGSTPNLNLSNSILREVTCAPSVLDDGLNLQFQSTSCSGSIPTMNPDTDPRLLQNNGGPTPTIALLEGSPAIDAIPIGDCVDQNNNAVKTDQRGFGRPAGPACDIGAFEFGATQAPGF